MHYNPSFRSMAIALLCACLMLLSVPLGAQERFGELSGTATDPSGAVLPDATVTATNATTQRAYTTRTSSDGTLSFVNSNRDSIPLSSNWQALRLTR